MRGIIKLVNNRTGMMAIETENGEYTIIELLEGCELEEGDTIIGDLDTLGGETFQKESTKESFDVFIEDIHATLACAKKFLTQKI